MNVTNFSIKRPVFTLVTMTLFLLLGAISLTNIPLKLIPDIEAPIAAIVTSYQDAGPEEVAEKISKPMENSLSTTSGLNNISTISMEGSSLTILEFSWTTSIDDVENDIITAMNQTPLPSGAGNPQFLKFDPSSFPIIQLSLSAAGDDVELDSLVREMESELLKIDGVATINLLGDEIDEIEVTLDQELLEENNLDQSDVVQTLQVHNVTAPGGVVQNGGSEITTRVLFELGGVEEIENIVLTTDVETGNDITVSEVAEVAVGPEPSDVITQTNQDDSILLDVQQQADANTAQVSRAFMTKIDKLLSENKYAEIESAVLFNQGEYIDDAIVNVALALVAGGIIAMIVLFLFLRSMKTPLLIGIAIPFSVIVTFVLLFFTNFSLNIMTLGGLALGIGMLVDNSIVVIENIYRHLSMKKDPKQAALDGTKEVATAITASTLTTVSVFLPVVFISGIVGNLFREFALTVSFSLLASLIVALTVVPMLASRWLKAPSENAEEVRRNSKFIHFFDRSTRWSLKNRAVVFIITFALLIAGGFGVTTVGTEFLPATDEGFFQIDIENEPGTPIDVTFEDVQEIEEILDDERLIKNYTSVTGSSGNQGPMAGSGNGHEAVIYVTMVPISDRDMSTMDVSENIRRDVERAASDADISISMNASFGSNPNSFSFDLNDSNPQQLEEVAGDLLAEFEDMSEFTEVSNTLEDTVQELQILIDDEAARAEGLSPAQIAGMVDNKTRGEFATQIVTNESDVLGVYVRYDEQYIEDVEALENLLLRSPQGSFIPLIDLATIEEGEGPETINRINQEESVQFSLSFGSDYNLSEINTIVEDTIESYGLPSETSYSFTGDQQLVENAISDLTLALILAIVFVYLVLAAQFESLRYPFVIMFTVPLVVIGVAIGLTITQTPISVTGFIGIIVLVGIVVNNSIVLVDYINQRKELGYRTYDAIVEGVKDRARPILMTASTTILALVPLALGFGEGTEIQQPLAITVISGMISATFLTLILIPIVYSFFDKETRHINRKYMMPDGQLIPAYLLDEKYSKDQGEGRMHYPQVNQQVPEKAKTDISEFYSAAEDEPANELDTYHQSINNSNSSENEDLMNENEQDTSFDHLKLENLPSRKERHQSEMSRDDLLNILERIVDRNQRDNKDK